MHEASFVGYLEGVQAITKYLRNINPGNANGLTPLHVAAIKGHLSIVEYFVENLNEINPAAGTLYSNWTPFHMAAINGHLEVCQMLLDTYNVLGKELKIESLATLIDKVADNGHFLLIQWINDNIKGNFSISKIIKAC